MRAGQWGVAVALVALLALLGTFPSSIAVPGPSAVAAPAAPSLATPGPTVPAAAPPIGCGANYPGYYDLLGEVWPLDPNFNYQTPCHLGAADEVHASFASGAAGSAERWSIPWTLPTQGAAGQQNVEEGLYVGMVVAGDPNSTWNQSYVEVLASPEVGVNNSLSWTVQLGVLSLSNSTLFHTSACKVHTTCCPTGSYNISWNDSAFCEIDDLAGFEPLPMLDDVAGGTSLAVTFDGSVGGGPGMDVWANETNGNLTTSAVQLNLTTTGTWSFEPAYSSACAGSCTLLWGLSYGLGVGIDICPVGTSLAAVCDSYNGSAYASLPPVTWGAPEFWNGSAYSNDFRYLQPESASGVCDTNPPAGVSVAPCYAFTGNGGNGFYPYFTLTGAGLTFGQTYAASVTTYGGAYNQFLDTSGTQDLNPLVLTDLTDSSLAGYVAPDAVIDVGLNVTDLGSITAVTLAYSVNGSAWTTLPLSGIGTASAGAYNGTIPTGPNGPVRFQVNATDQAGLLVSSSVRTVLRGPLPSFSVGIGIAPGTCGIVTVDGKGYQNGSVASLGPGPASLAATGCYPYNFSSWQVTPALAVAPSNTSAATLTVGGDGNLSADFTYERPTETLTVGITPVGCGDVVLGGVGYGNGAVVPLLYGLSNNLSYSVSCGGYAFGGWSPGPNVTVLGPSLVMLNNGTLNASFVPTSATVPVAFATTPVACGGVGLGGAAYTTGESVYLASGVYPLTPTPCRHFGFENFTTNGSGLSVSGTSLTVEGSGTVTEHNFALTEAYVDTSPGTCGGIEVDGNEYTDGAYVPLENHSAYTVTAFTCPGHFLDAFSASGGLTLAGSLLTVNGSGTLLVVSLPGTASIFVGFVTTPSYCGAIELNGTQYGNGAFLSLAPDEVLPIAGLPCDHYGLVGWALTGDIAIVGNVAYLNGSGAITAIFGGLISVIFQTVPATCGATLIDGVAYADDTTATLIDGANYTIAPAPCAHYELDQFESSPYVAIQNGSIAPAGPSTITAVFVPIPYTVTTTVLGPGCGTVSLAGVVVGTGTVVNVSYGSFPLTEVACLTSTFAGYTLSGNLSVAAGQLLVNGSGTLTATFLPVAPSVALGGSAASFVGGTAFFFATVAIPVGTSGYSYLWNFGDGSTNATTGNTTTHVFTSTGTFTVSVQVTDPYHRTANATLVVTVGAQPSTAYGATFTTGLLVLGAAALVLLGVALVARRRAPPPGPPSESAVAESPPALGTAPEPPAPPESGSG
jgi:hypothetical protein